MPDTKKKKKKKVGNAGTGGCGIPGLKGEGHGSPCLEHSRMMGMMKVAKISGSSVYWKEKY